MSERRILIADDEPLARERLRTLLGKIGGWRVVAECEDGRATVQATLAERPDVVLLDIRMPEMDGLEVAEEIEKLGARAPAIVFVTAFDQFALRAFDVDAADYVVKPVELDRLRRALDRALQSAPNEAPYPRRFLVRGTQGLYFVRTADVEWVDAQGNYARLHASGRAHLLRATMKTLEAQLDPRQFVRIHRSAIVNIDCIERIEPYTHGEHVVTLRDGSRLASSRAHSAGLKTLLGNSSRAGA